MRPRRAQVSINVRSDFIAERLKSLMQDGKSQAAVLEELVAKAVEPERPVGDRDKETFQRALEIADRSSQGQARFQSMAEFDAHEYGPDGNCR